MELLAVVNAIKKIIKDHVEGQDYELYSDSAYVVNSINNGWVDNWYMNGWRTTKGDDIKNKDLWLQLIKYKGKLLSEGIQLNIFKIKGHSGNTFNEYVDKLAKEQVLKARMEDR